MKLNKENWINKIMIKKMMIKIKIMVIMEVVKIKRRKRIKRKKINNHNNKLWK